MFAPLLCPSLLLRSLSFDAVLLLPLLIALVGIIDLEEVRLGTGMPELERPFLSVVGRLRMILVRSGAVDVRRVATSRLVLIGEVAFD